MDCHVCIARLRISLNPRTRKAEKCLSLWLLTDSERKQDTKYITKSNLSVSAVQEAKPCAVHGLFVANMWNLSAVGQLTQRKACTLLKLQGKKFQLSWKRIGPIGDK